MASRRHRVRATDALLAFLPFVVFALADRLVGSTAALIAGAVTAAAMILHGSLLHDAYTKLVLTVIAAALVGIVVQNAVGRVSAQSDRLNAF